MVKSTVTFSSFTVYGNGVLDESIVVFVGHLHGAQPQHSGGKNHFLFFFAPVLKGSEIYSIFTVLSDKVSRSPRL